jgi:hypothetical protein
MSWFLKAFAIKCNLYRYDTESAWKDPLLGNASATPKFTTVTFDVTSIDGERVMLANVTIPTLGHLYTTLTVDGLNVNLSSVGMYTLNSVDP